MYSVRGLLRAWPICLRSVAVRHVRDRVASGRLIPSTLGVLLNSGVVINGTTRDEQIAVNAFWGKGIVHDVGGLDDGGSSRCSYSAYLFCVNS